MSERLTSEAAAERLFNLLDKIKENYPFISDVVPVSTQRQLLNLLRIGPTLPQQTFFDPTPFYDDTEAAVECYLGPRHDFGLPVRNFIYAKGFLSWEEGRPETKLIDGKRMKGPEIIGHYTTLRTVSPSISLVSGFAQPNGYVLYRVDNGAYRTAAAIARDDEIIATNNLWLYRLEENIVS